MPVNKWKNFEATCGENLCPICNKDVGENIIPCDKYQEYIHYSCISKEHCLNCDENIDCKYRGNPNLQ